jgi:NAD-specific glutamate dehydrogenase
MLEAVDWLVESVARWYLAGSRQIPTAEQLEADKATFAELESFVRQPRWHQWTEDTEEVTALTEAGISAALADQHTHLDDLVHGPDIIESARAHGRSVSEVARLFMLIGSSYRLDWLEHQVSEIAASSRWHRWAVRSIQSDLIELRRDLADKVLETGAGLEVEQALQAYRRDRADRHARLDELMQSVAQEEAASLDPLLVAVRQIRALAG